MSEDTMSNGTLDIDLETQQMQNLRNQIESNKQLAKALDENPAAVSNAITHLMLGGLLQGLSVLEVKLNQLQANQQQPRIFTP